MGDGTEASRSVGTSRAGARRLRGSRRNGRGAPGFPAGLSFGVIRLEMPIALGPLLALVAIGLLLTALERLQVLGGAMLWRRHFEENLESFLPLAVALGAAGLGLVELEAGMVEMTAGLPAERILGLRLGLQQAVSWCIVLVGTVAMAAAWGPVAFWDGWVSALGPGLFLSGLALWSATASGRIAVGYLLSIGLLVLDLVLQVLGAFRAVPPLSLLNLFAYRWNVPAVPWPWVKAVQAAAGLLLMVMVVARIRRYQARHL